MLCESEGRESVPGHRLGFRLPVDGRGGIVGSRADRIQPNQPVDRLLTQHMLAIKLGHARVLGFVFQLVVARA